MRTVMAGMSLVAVGAPRYQFASSVEEVFERERAELPEAPDVILAELRARGILRSRAAARV